ncbi:5-formyltetrahydrofolate cyclo-ligase [Corynebacterium sp.]|jgi:5-formyltetrahydrofolate cyclo-ligase|uniref:5-formyltetrahydrofolate cyclo-ligase n=1 Tax=Corynebacterium sp. TaxID=1720 RepID=UPI0025C32A55|nr:5-formyltetrahydrofolate cyclo-ligase [Corynebacterium sp.]
MEQGDHTDVPAAKQALRRHIRDARRAVPADERTRRDASITAHLLRLLARDDQGDGGGTGPVAAFAGLPGEPGGPGLPEALHRAGHEVWLPVVPGPSRPLTWLPYRGAAAMRRGAFGIAEPTTETGTTGTTETSGHRSPISSVDLSGRVTTLVIPALAVDRDGTRLGQGGGYYDRTLDILTDRGGPGRLVALVDHAEFGVDVPRTPLDARVQTVVTDSGVFPTSADHRGHR